MENTLHVRGEGSGSTCDDACYYYLGGIVLCRALAFHTLRVGVAGGRHTRGLRARQGGPLL